MFTYIAYGLGIHSAVELPELVPGPAPPDVVVRVGAIPDSSRGQAANGSVLRATPDEVCLHWEEAGTILVRQGREITLDPRPGTDSDVLRLYLLGPALALLLHQRGLLVLHASAVALDGGAAAFLGYAGRGKSTTAATLHARGYPVLADDVVAVDLSTPEAPGALPGFPQLKLWPDAVTALGGSPEGLPRVHPARRSGRAWWAPRRPRPGHCAASTCSPTPSPSSSSRSAATRPSSSCSSTPTSPRLSRAWARPAISPSARAWRGPRPSVACAGRGPSRGSASWRPSSRPT